MKTALPLIIALLVSVNATADARVNAKESLRICQGAIESEYSETADVKFKRKSASSVDIDRYRHWINLFELQGDEKTSKRVLCETNREGEVLSMKFKAGKWRF